MAADPALRTATKLFAILKAEHMSGDESDKDFPDTFQAVDAQWMSVKMRTFLHALDERVLEDRANPIGTRKPVGRPPRVRLPSEGKSANSRAPKGLPVNCYDDAWLQKLKPHQRMVLDAVDIPFDFASVMNEDDSDMDTQGP